MPSSRSTILSLLFPYKTRGCYLWTMESLNKEVCWSFTLVHKHLYSECTGIPVEAVIIRPDLQHLSRVAEEEKEKDALVAPQLSRAADGGDAGIRWPSWMYCTYRRAYCGIITSLLR
jgi:hypothetical protein